MRSPACGVLVLTPMAFLAPCHASDPISSVLACRQIADAAQRLACYDRESAALAAPPATSAARPAPSTAPSTTSAALVTAGPPATAAPPVATAPPVTVAPVVTPAPPVSAAPAVTAAALAHSEEAKQSFGLPESSIAAKEVAAGTRSADINKIVAHITVVSVTSGKAVFTLDNGQAWRQLLSEGDLLAKPGDGVTISRGLLHSYWLALKSGRGCKVTRIR
jgi:hypothetical protein